MTIPLTTILALAEGDAALLVGAIVSMAGANVWALKTVIAKLTESVDRTSNEIAQVRQELAQGRVDMASMLAELRDLRRDFDSHVVNHTSTREIA